MLGMDEELLNALIKQNSGLNNSRRSVTILLEVVASSKCRYVADAFHRLFSRSEYDSRSQGSAGQQTTYHAGVHSGGHAEDRILL